MEEDMIRAVLAQTDGNRKEAARILGIGERTLYRKLKKYQLG
jgi:two-component system response regulator HydG